ncbi:hypothetical protein DPMN_182125 [Dreissena polymorpha]|uniref:Uncharacterized protein n=1 Tax=Dreissena polymorpha TaxID=45954 RepID=A0A9D4DEX3_DREPO|nr:hypothetical protein DPMN_182125 [Dreissena polymorpha]
MSNIEIMVKYGSKELFEILRDTSIGILCLRTADDASLATAGFFTRSTSLQSSICGGQIRVDVISSCLLHCSVLV